MTAMKKRGQAVLVSRSTFMVKKKKKKKECPDICVGHALQGPNFSQLHRPRLRQSRAKNGAQGRGK